MTDLMFEIGFGFTIAGILLALAAVTLMILSGKKGADRARGGGILLIGPVPIIFGTDRESATFLILLAIALIAIVMVLMILPYWLR
ncbi:MAG: DUF131 domain-containing protein [Candidatus Bathyarchaeia archaeon]